MSEPTKRPTDLRYSLLTGVGGIGAGIFFQLEGNHTLGRNESRPARLLPVRDYCKLHIISHYVAALLAADTVTGQFQVMPIGKVGKDQPGADMQQEMAEAGMDLRFVHSVPDLPTLMSVCFHYPDGAGGNLTTTHSAAAALTTEDINLVEPLLRTAGRRAIALAAPEVPLPRRQHLLQLAQRCGAMRVLVITSAEADQAKTMDIFALADLLAVNEDEAVAIAGRPFDDGQTDAFLAALGESLGVQSREMSIIFTAGPRGAWTFANGQWSHRPAIKAKVASTAGAGDALLGGVIAGLAGGLPLAPKSSDFTDAAERPLTGAADLGALLASFAITSPHTIHPDVSGQSLLQLAASLDVTLSHQMEQFLSR